MFNAAARPSALVSIVIPVYNESANLEALWARLEPVITGLGHECEVVFVDDGSSDGSLEMLRGMAARDARVRVVELARNFGQHSALLAGFRNCAGEIVVTLDADLQNPPEEIPRLIEAIEAGNDVVGGWREERQDRPYRRFASRLHNRITSAIVGVPMHDYGCMLRAYRRHIVETVVACDEKAAFVPALANSFAKRVAEIPVAHAERAGGESKYNLFRLAHLSLNLITGFSNFPIRALSLTGLGISFLAGVLASALIAHRLFYGPQQEGALWSLFALLFFFVGLIFLALGLIGEYIGRIYLEVRRRPTYIVRAVHGDHSGDGAQPKTERRNSIPVGVRSAPCVLFAYHEMGAACMEELIRLGAPIAALFTHEDAPGEEIWWRSCAEIARARGIPVYTPERIDEEWIGRIAAMRPAVIYSFYYRNLLPEAVIRLAPLGAYNLHGSLLPNYRGRAPVNWMIANGEREGGVTLHHMVARADAGDIVAQSAVAIGDDDDALTLYRKIVPLGAALMREYHPLIVAGVAPRRAQDLSSGSYFGRRRPDDGRIDWNWPARRICNLVRAVTHPYPGAFCHVGGRKLYVWRARIGTEEGRRGTPGTIVGVVEGDAVEIAAGVGSVIVMRAQFEGGAEAAAVVVLGAGEREIRFE